nr:glutamate receptor ionotropic, delta-1-like [Procambarus clarkii]
MAAMMVMSSTTILSQEVVGQVGEVVGQVGEVVGQVVKYHLSDCHLVLITAARHSPITSSIIRHLSVGGVACVVVEAGSVVSQDHLAQDHLLQQLWGDATTTCRGLILDLTSTNDSEVVLRLSETAGLRKKSDTVVVAVGGRAGVREVLLHHSLRNTLHALYLALHHHTSLTPPPHPASRLGKPHTGEGTVNGDVWVYRRCMYCGDGEANIQVIGNWMVQSIAQDIHALFNEQLNTMMGHKLSVVAVPHFPYMDFDRSTEGPGGVISPKDTVDSRLIHTFANVLNFTFEIREEHELSWGLLENGVFTGMMGQLQREETDLCAAAGPSPERLRVVDFLRGYPSDLMTLTSLKPSLLPKNLSLIRPFTGELWVALLVSVVVCGVILWLLQRAWQWVAGGRRISYSSILLYIWGDLMEQTAIHLSVSYSGRVLVGWWLVFCLVVTTGYRSSMVAHMTIQGKTRPIETFEDLAKQHNWRWGTEPWLLKGVPYEYFSKHPDPLIQHIYRNMEKVSREEALKKVLAGSYTLVVWENNLYITIASYYTDTHGNTPYFTSKKGVSIMAAFGWGFRKGAPFYPRFHQIISRLEDAGIISYWTKETISKRVRENRASAALDTQIILAHTDQDDGKEVVLGMQHLQGAFYLLILGYSVAFLTLLGENLTRCWSSPR